jgi:dolichyl-phosphate-mannose-protein mannosyltransferase
VATVGRLAKRKKPRPDAPATPPPAAAPAPPTATGGAWAEAFAGLAVLAVYLRTLAPTVVGGDSGELVTVAATLGVAHPPGYPLYTLLAHAFTWLPFGGVPARVNLLSAVCGALAAALACRAVRRATGEAWSGVLAAGALAFSPLVWPYAVTAEVFPLNDLFVAALALCAVEAERTDEPAVRRRALAAFAFLAGLAAANHHTIVFVAAPFAVYLLARNRALLAPRLVLALAAAAAAGASPYLYLPWAAARGPAIAWGDPSSGAGFLAHVLRREYGTFQLAPAGVGGGGGALPLVADLAWESTAGTFGLAPLLVAAALACARLRTARGRLTVLFAGTVAFYVVSFASLANLRQDDALHRTMQDRFWQQAVVLVALLMGLGLAGLQERLGAAARAAAPAVALAACVALAFAHWRTGDHRGHTFVRDYGRAILDALPEHAILLVTSDEAVGAVRYLQQVEGVRSDVRALPTGQITRPWFRPQAERLGVALPPGADFTARAFLDANASRAPVFVANRVPWLASLEEAYRLWPVGLVEELTPKDAPPDPDGWTRRVDEAYARFDPRAGRAYPAGTWESYVAENAAALDRRFSLALPRAAGSRAEDPAVARAVVRGLEAYLARQPAPDAVAEKNLGVAYQLLARSEPAALASAARHFQTALALHPADPDREAMRALIARAQAAPPPASPPPR